MVALVKVVRPKVQATLNYEVWRIQSHNGYVLAGRKIEAGESIPSTSTWGRQGWSYCADDYEGAKKKYLSLIEK